jgi:parallel beta-helix repeat protein
MRDGIEMASVSSNEIRGNKINGNGRWGITVRTDTLVSQQNQFVANELIGNTEFGIRLRNSVNNTIRNNRVSGTVVAGVGISLETSSGNTVRNNRTTQNDRGIVVGLLSLNNVIETNTSVENAVFDLEDDNPACDANVWRNNNFNTASQPCIQ